MPEKAVRLLATFFYIGECPVAPGTAASFAGALLAIIFHGSAFFYLLVTALIIVVGFRVSGEMETLVKQKDPSCVVIDEVAGVMIAMFGLPLNIPVLVTAFFLFRAFDMFKIYPVSKFESLPGASGIMMDDLVAGLYTMVVMQAAVRFSSIL